ncbi:MAG TPA: T9SS type A sorting domain-containing protein, partial [Ignavibacteriaceae bacterium]|nr:T9SS type A sorting domain-containing protein [Ignavibacteriaceae bacterium]
GYNIVGINSNAIIPSLGAIHCIVKEVGVKDPVFISHAKMDSVVATADPIEIQAVLKSKSGIVESYVHWTSDTLAGFNFAVMNFVSGDTASAIIPAQVDGTEIFYYLSATSNSGRTVTKPLPAPSGFYKFMVENSITAVNENDLPDEFILFQNFPNPFNPATKIKYQIPTAQVSVQIKVYDILGNEIATLVNEEKSAGTYEIEFDALRLSSGIYFYRMIAGNYSEIKKMILIR